MSAPSPTRQIELVEIFAAEAAIAIETRAPRVTDLAHRARTGELAAAVRRTGRDVGERAGRDGVLARRCRRRCSRLSSTAWRRSARRRRRRFLGVRWRVLPGARAARGLAGAAPDQPFEVPADSDLMRMVMGKDGGPPARQPRRPRPPIGAAIRRRSRRSRRWRADGSLRADDEGRPRYRRPLRRSEAKCAPSATATSILAKDFAAQAVIAAWRTRAASDRARPAHRRFAGRARPANTAIGDVLKVISRSAVDLDAVLQTAVTAAVRLALPRGICRHLPQRGRRVPLGRGARPDAGLCPIRGAQIRSVPGTGTIRVGRASRSRPHPCGSRMPGPIRSTSQRTRRGPPTRAPCWACRCCARDR